MNPGSDLATTCSVFLPECGSTTAIDTADLFADIADADVQRALMTSPAPVYGNRTAISGRFGFTDGTTGSFYVIVASDCTTATSTCEPTPTGVRRLVDDVLTAVEYALASPDCVNLR